MGYRCGQCLCLCERVGMHVVMCVCVFEQEEENGHMCDLGSAFVCVSIIEYACEYVCMCLLQRMREGNTSPTRKVPLYVLHKYMCNQDMYICMHIGKYIHTHYRIYIHTHTHTMENTHTHLVGKKTHTHTIQNTHTHIIGYIYIYIYI
jgi:hypothetical protein